MRTCAGHPFWSQSRDDGVTWSKPEKLLDRDGGTPYLHPRSPCPIYDWKGCEAAGGYYFALVHNTFDFNGEREYQNRGPLYLIAGRFNPDAKQPIEFSEPKLFAPPRQRKLILHQLYHPWTGREYSGSRTRSSIYSAARLARSGLSSASALNFAYSAAGSGPAKHRPPPLGNGSHTENPLWRGISAARNRGMLVPPWDSQASWSDLAKQGGGGIFRGNGGGVRPPRGNGDRLRAPLQENCKLQGWAHSSASQRRKQGRRG